MSNDNFNIKTEQIKIQLDEVKDTMVQNIEMTLERGEKLDHMVERTEQLNTSANMFRRNAKKLRSHLCMQNWKYKLGILSIVILFGLFLWLIISINNN